MAYLTRPASRQMKQPGLGLVSRARFIDRVRRWRSTASAAQGLDRAGNLIDDPDTSVRAANRTGFDPARRRRRR